jgi:hypothetical protein
MASGHRRHRPRHGRARWRWPLAALCAGGGVIVAGAVALAVGIGSVAGTPACAAVRSAAEQAAADGSQEATHYVLAGLPNCSYSPPADGLYVALPAPEYASAAQCGSYLQVTGPDGTVRVKVIDQCPECAAGHIDLSETAFARLAPLSTGLVGVSYTPVTDPALPGPLSAEVKQGSSPYWLALLIANAGNPLASVEVKTASGWVSLARASYNYWIAASGAGPGPFTVRVTDTQGHQVTVAGITLTPDAVQSTGTWMYGAGSGTAPSAAATSAAATGAAPSSTGSASARPRPPAKPSPSAARSRTTAARGTVTVSGATAGQASPSATGSAVPSVQSSC